MSEQCRCCEQAQHGSGIADGMCAACAATHAEYRQQMLGADELAAIRARADAATRGEWTWEDDPPTVYAGRGPFAHGLNLFGRLSPDMNGPANLEFVTHAHQDVPRLLAHSDALAAELAALKDAAREYMACVEADDRPGHYTEQQLARDLAAQERLRALVGEAGEGRWR